MSTATRGPDGPGAAKPSTARPPCRESGTAAAVAAASDRIAFRDVPIVILAAAAIIAIVLGPGWTAAMGPWVWIASLAIVGLPHGAADIAVGRVLAGRSVRELLIGCLLYAAGMACVAATFAVFPAATIVLFSVVSIWHFGIGHRDTEPDGTRGEATGPGESRWTWAAEASAAMARAGVVLGVPAAAWPGPTAAVANRLVLLLHGERASNATPFDPHVVGVAGWSLLAAAAAAIVGEAVVRRGRGLGWLLLEEGVFATLAWFADPLFSVGLYYLCWHAWRHMRPLTHGAEPGSLAAAVFRIHLRGLPLLLPTCAVLGGLWWLLSPGRSPRDLAILSIGVYLVVTPSHDVLVRRFRDRQGPKEVP